MKKIVVTEPLNFFDDQRERLNSLGDVTEFDSIADSYDEWLKRVEGADIICSRKFGLQQNIGNLKDVFVAVPFVGVGWADPKTLEENNIVLSVATGCNKEAVAEWVIGMMINLLRNLPEVINSPEVKNLSTKSVTGKNVLICGAGNVGKNVGELCEALNANVAYFTRDDDIIESAKYADVIVDTLALNDETRGIYDKSFFSSLQQGSYFVTISQGKTWEPDALIEALDQGILAGTAVDMGIVNTEESRMPLYERLVENPKALVTASVNFNNDRVNRNCNDKMIDNVEQYIKFLK